MHFDARVRAGVCVCVYNSLIFSIATDPIVIWYQGGPGASSFFGLLIEWGPFLLNDLSLMDPAYNKTGIPQLIRNPYSYVHASNLAPLSPM